MEARSRAIDTLNTLWFLKGHVLPHIENNNGDLEAFALCLCPITQVILPAFFFLPINIPSQNLVRDERYRRFRKCMLNVSYDLPDIDAVSELFPPFTHSLPQHIDREWDRIASRMKLDGRHNRDNILALKKLGVVNILLMRRVKIYQAKCCWNAYSLWLYVTARATHKSLRMTLYYWSVHDEEHESSDSSMFLLGAYYPNL